MYVAITSGLDIDPEKFEGFIQHWKDIYFDPENGCSWYGQPPTLHRATEHGRAILEGLPVPLGLLSEEGAEGNNKEIKRFRACHARTTSRLDNMTDVVLRQIHRSDPVILDEVVARHLTKRPQRALPAEVIALLRTPDVEILPQIDDPRPLEEEIEFEN
jgi:hypothetical protein